ncbi:aminopeptidase [Vagococcus humatus]|uniref:Aminopeptidase n=1 Tax=Vagococcus humatus TaxID=1889241 RepID=A0A429Z8T7_9ENTE|nr:aminopeptidase [Vagococcus humatus]RST90104.1 aminopeptidase [Vagococcus humatus]
MNQKELDTYLDKYAKLIVETGVNVRKNHTVVLRIAVDQVVLARKIVKEAYQHGAKQVILQWSDDLIQREFFLHADEECLTTIPEYKVDEMNDWVEKGASRISIISSNPDALKGIDSDRIATYQSAMGKASTTMMEATQSNKVSWLVAAAAGSEWAAKVFPELASSEEQVMALWDQIFKTTRIYDKDPVQSWTDHDALLTKKAQELNEAQFDALHYTAPGTDLIVGLPKNHVWSGASSLNSRGEKFMPNMPTEEVFTAPDCRRVDGTIVSTKPLSYAGTTISGMSFTFKDGLITEFSAEQGEEVLGKLLATDEGAKKLGEVALVPDPSPISQSGVTFYNTLFDENASNHLAVGQAYAFCVENGTEMSYTELQEAGLNRSTTHVDFMVGSNQMNIDGIKSDGTRVPVFRNGDWA